jgi:hypothetical protein
VNSWEAASSQLPTSQAGDTVDSEDPINSSHTNIPTPEEVWTEITPKPIRKAVIGRQNKFAEEASAIRWTTAENCHAALCAGTSAPHDAPTVLDRFYQQYAQELGARVRKTFWHLLGSALGHDDELERIPVKWAREPVEWAKLQVQKLIYEEAPMVRLWLQVACDGQPNGQALLQSSLKAGCIQGPAKQKDMINELQEYLEEQFPTKKTSAWRARTFLSMVPLGSLPYDVKTAWNYESDFYTRQIISDKRDNLNVALRWELKLAADDAHELRAKASLNVDTCNQQAQGSSGSSRTGFIDSYPTEIEGAEKSEAGKPYTYVQQNKKEHVELGSWAEARLEEARRFVRLVRGGKPPESLRPQFSALFTEVIDRLSTLKRDRFFEEAQRRRMTVPDLMGWIADVKELRGTTLADYRKEYRRETGTARKHRQAST